MPAKTASLALTGQIYSTILTFLGFKSRQFCEERPKTAECAIYAEFCANVAKYGTKSAIAGDMLNQSVRLNVPNFNKPLVKYYGPTMGKTTAKSENLIDFDDIMRPIKESLAKDLGITREELVKSGHPALQQAYADQINL